MVKTSRLNSSVPASWVTWAGVLISRVVSSGRTFDSNAFTPYGPSLAAALPQLVETLEVVGACSREAAEFAANMHVAKNASDGWDGRDGRDPDPNQREYPGLVAKLEGGPPFDICIIMCGTNDLGVQEDLGVQIARDIIKLHAACHARGVRTIACSIPPQYNNTVVSGDADFIGGDRGHHHFQKCWRDANAKLEEWADTRPAKVKFVDTSDLVPFTGEPEWADNLHMSKALYARFGQRLAIEIEGFLEGR